MRLHKSLGQHFLTDEHVCQKIVDFVISKQPKALVEIGPGAGALTKYFIHNTIINNFFAIEIDKEKVAYLNNKHPLLEKKIILQDILKASPPFLSSFGVVGNFPYNISSQILFKMIEWKDRVEFMVGMFQKELAQRVIAKPNNKEYGILSILIQLFFDVEILFDISPNAFNPPPKVWSSILFLTPKKLTYNINDYNFFSTIIKTCFQQRRKQLKNTLSPFFTKQYLSENDFFVKRPENLSIDDFYNLYLEALKYKDTDTDADKRM